MTDGSALSPRRLLVRVYLHGVLMLVLAFVAAFLVGRYVLRPALDGPPRPSTTWIVWHMASLTADPETLARELSDLKDRVGIELTFYAGETLLASNSEAPPPPLTAARRARLAARETRFEGRSGVVVVSGAGAGATYAIVRSPEIVFPWSIVAAELAVVLIVLAVASIPLARYITAPVEKLRRAARAFGGGDLSARAALRRRDEIGELSRTFDEMADRIAELRRSEKELLANVSHELRTPLARIRLALELLADGDAKKAQTYLGDIDDDLVELEQLLDDVMTTARLDLATDSGSAAVPPLRLERISARALLEASASRFAKRHPERQLALRLAVDSQDLEADAQLLRRVVDNLLDNAVKFSDPHTPIELAGSYVPEQGEIVVQVDDRGIGIPAEDRARIFNPFFRGDPSRTRATGGVGLGLALVRRVVEAHGGRIEVTSEPARGSQFRVSLKASSSPTG